MAFHVAGRVFLAHIHAEVGSLNTTRHDPDTHESNSRHAERQHEKRPSAGKAGKGYGTPARDRRQPQIAVVILIFGFLRGAANAGIGLQR